MNRILLPWIAPHIEKLTWYNLSKYIPEMYLLEQNLDKIRWDALCENINAIPLLEKNIDKI